MSQLRFNPHLSLGSKRFPSRHSERNVRLKVTEESWALLWVRVGGSRSWSLTEQPPDQLVDLVVQTPGASFTATSEVLSKRYVLAGSSMPKCGMKGMRLLRCRRARWFFPPQMFASSCVDVSALACGFGLFLFDCANSAHHQL